ncbi:DUF1919 domain-containing protein [Allofournierella sp.]|uniref:DUF1919 domain-containing protein n=1 Tax=Allofournierella sp. TaxID=1940256 RepID=UPI003AB14F4B
MEEAQEKWNARKKRIDWNNVFYIFNDRNGCTQKDLEEFDALPYPHKIVFTHIPHPEIKCAVVVPNCECKPCVPIMTAYKKGSLVRREYDCFDYVGWINRNS